VTPTNDDGLTLAEQVHQALDARDLDAFGSLLSDDVRWGTDDHPRACRNRSDVLATFSRILAEGAEGEVAEIATGPRGILCGLAVSWPSPEVHQDDRRLYHVYLTEGGRIVEIRRYDDRHSAAAAVGLSTP
jgi:ketosteroid isomerase-like protein